MSLEDVRVGDEIAVHHRVRGWMRYPVDRITKTQVACGDVRFRKSDGRMIGSDGWFAFYAVPMTVEIRRDIAVQNARRYIAKDRRDLTDDQAVAVAKAIAEALRETPAKAAPTPPAQSRSNTQSPQ